MEPFLAQFDGPLLNKLCKETLADSDDSILLDRLQKAFPDYPLKIARQGHEWYRLGGIIKRDGMRVAADIGEWAERTFIECGQDLTTLLDHCERENFLVTQHIGVSLYVVAKTGPKAEDFVQIEIDRTQELAYRYLVDWDQPPEDLEELIDPLNPIMLEPFAVGASRYAYRRKTDVALFMRELGRHRAERDPAQRFIDDWNASSAASGKTFCDEWSLRLYQYIGRHREQVMKVEIVQNRAKDVPRLEGPDGKRGKSLAAVIGRFDSQAGFPFAWYFYMLKGLVSPHVGEAVQRDLSKDYAYLPDKDAAILAQWASEPYCL